MNKRDFWTIIALHWALFIAILFISWLVMSTNNLETELEYMKNYNRVITTENLQDIMCNGDPV
jgi:hypothetical protein